MRYTIYNGLLAAMVSPFLSGNVATADEVVRPFRARVVVSEAEVRSGPGTEYHVAGVLPENTPVDVRRQSGGGWLGIRPTEGSFSWVFGRHVDVLADRSGRVNKDSVPARVGGSHHDPRQVVQIRLQKNERVKILGEERTSGQLWYKIAPPLGELRWVHVNDIEGSPDLGESDFESPVPRPEATAEGHSAIGDVVLEELAPPQSENVTESPATDDDVSPTRPDGESNREQGVTAPKNTDPVASSGWVTSASHEEPVEVESPEEGSPAIGESARRQFDADFTKKMLAIELRLSQTIAGNREQWQLRRLENEAETLLHGALTVAEREAAKRLLAKIDRFASIQRRFERIAATPPTATVPTIAPPSLPATTLFAPAVRPSPPPTAYSPLPPFAPPQPTVQPPASGRALFGLRPKSSSVQPRIAHSSTGRHDVVGQLRPVVSRQPGAPQYALVDDAGHVITFVTPTPDVDIDEFLGQRVGVSGPQEFLPEFRQSHVTAGRVIPLATPLRR